MMTVGTTSTRAHLLDAPGALLPAPPTQPNRRQRAGAVGCSRPARPAGLHGPGGADHVAGGTRSVSSGHRTRPSSEPGELDGGRAARLVAVAVATVIVVCGLAGIAEVASGAGGVPSTTSVVRVGAGETVWDVAERVAPGSDPWPVVERIRELNAMTGSSLRPGQPLRVPDAR